MCERTYKIIHIGNGRVYTADIKEQAFSLYSWWSDWCRKKNNKNPPPHKVTTLKCFTLLPHIQKEHATRKQTSQTMKTHLHPALSCSCNCKSLWVFDPVILWEHICSWRSLQILQSLQPAGEGLSLTNFNIIPVQITWNYWTQQNGIAIFKILQDNVEESWWMGSKGRWNW